MTDHPRCFAPAILLTLLLATPGLAQGTATVSPIKDNTLYEDLSGGLSNGAGAHLFAGRTATGTVRRAVLSFDIAGSIPAGSTITSVALTLNMSKTIAGPVPITLHALLADWGEGASNAPGSEGAGAPSQAGDATWIHTSFPSAMWSSAGGDFAAAASATQSVAGLGSYTWSSTSNPGMITDVQGWLANPTTNFGWLVKSPETSLSTAKRFDSRENAAAASQPQLVISFMAPTMASAVSTGTGCGGAAPGPLTLGAVGLPSLGNPSFGLSISGGPPGGLADLFLANGLAATPLALGGGCSIYLDLPSALNLINLGVSPLGPLPLNGSGGFSLFFGIPADPALSGFSIDIQTLVLDFTVPGNFVSSNALSLVFGI